MTSYNRRTVLQGIGAVGTASVLGVGTVAADDGDDGDGDAKLRAAHAVPDAPAVDVLVDGNVAVPGLEFRDVTGYLELAAGKKYEIAINEAGTDNEVFSTTRELSADDFTAAATGNLEPEGEEDGFYLDIFEDKLGAIEHGKGRVRAYHLSPDAPAVDVAVAGEDDEPAVFLAQGIEFGEAGPNVEVADDTYPVAVYPAGSDTPVFGPENVNVNGGQVLSAFAEGELNPEGDEDGFTVVKAYEEAAPFGRGGRGGGGRGGDDEDDEDEDEEEKEDD